MEESRYKVSIIIPHYNQAECLKTLLPSVVNQTFSDYEVIIIDDCSRDRLAVEYIKSFIRDHKNMRLVENTENMRFIKTVNKGIKLANAEYICLLNADTEVSSNFVEKNVKILDVDSSIGALTCVIVNRNGKNWFSGGILRAGLPVNLRDDFVGIRPVDFVAGTAAFYRKRVFDEIGYFSDNYRMYHEDVEFGLRIKTKTRYKACVFSEKLVIHYLVGSIPRYDIYYLGHRNSLFILREYFPEYIPKVLLLQYTRGVASLIGVTILLKLTPKDFLFSLLGILKGTKEGLFTKLGN